MNQLKLDYNGFFCRLTLAALHFNENACRDQAITKDGSRQWRISSRLGEAIAKEVKIEQTFGKITVSHTTNLQKNTLKKT